MTESEVKAYHSGKSNWVKPRKSHSAQSMS